MQFIRLFVFIPLLNIHCSFAEYQTVQADTSSDSTTPNEIENLSGDDIISILEGKVTFTLLLESCSTF